MRHFVTLIDFQVLRVCYLILYYPVLAKLGQQLKNHGPCFSLFMANG